MQGGRRKTDARGLRAPRLDFDARPRTPSWPRRPVWIEGYSPQLPRPVNVMLRPKIEIVKRMAISCEREIRRLDSVEPPLDPTAILRGGESFVKLLAVAAD